MSLSFCLPVLAGVFSLSVRAAFFGVGGVGGGGLTAGKWALKWKGLASGSKTALEQVCRFGDGVFFFSAFY